MARGGAVLHPPQRFVVDTMLGTLARWLRALGYDTLYFGQAQDRVLRRVAIQEDRVLVTRDRRLALLARPRACLIRAEELDDQITELLAALGLAADEERWLSRCLDCNTLLTRATRTRCAAGSPSMSWRPTGRSPTAPGAGRRTGRGATPTACSSG